MENLEFEVLDSFERVLKASLIKELPAFERLFRELQGSADFVGFPHEKLIGTYDFSKLSSLEHGSLVLSILKYNSGRTKDYIKERTGITDTALNRTLRELKANDFLVKKKNLYFLSKSFVQESDNIWAFDIKAPNWKRALQQAGLHKAFANYVVVVRPFDEEETLQEKLELFTELNVGLLLFNFQNLEFKWLRRPLKDNALSKWQKLFFLGRLSAQHYQESLFSFK
ncbi:MAG: hypothetical protein IKC41_01055 [Clostridia bacterium]|nr:hypothetical protein [Phascolarctobacterium sp.]MBR2220501.1 hypothetical protein [Phascolarctobacterium sp.]MBR2972776.1 hypothetical protein [Clostridia bacterium]